MKNFNFDTLNPTKIKQFNNETLTEIANEIRLFLLSLAKQKEIHLSSNLGIIEISISLIKKFNILKDTIIYDTGHQTYPHKILTGRYLELLKLKELNGPSGLMDMTSSKYDHYSPGHSGNSLSVISGLYDEIKFINDKHYYVCVIGDSAINNGLAFEGLNDIGYNQSKIIVVINDNEMSISKAKGIIINHLKNINHTDNIFTKFGFQYLYVENGHDIELLNKSFNYAKKLVHHGPVIVHVKTTKGKGHKLAEIDKIGTWHTNSLNNKITFGQIACQNLTKKLIKNKKMWILNPAMNIGSGFVDLYNSNHPRYIDTGICESHTISKASGLALNKQKVFCLFYSTFLQRSYDQLIHDCARLNLNITILLDRSDVATNEGDSHHGIFDVAYLKSIPNTTICTPRNFEQLNQLIDYYYKNNYGINVIRYPIMPFTNNKINVNYKIKRTNIECLINNNNKVAILTYGPYTDVLYENITNQNIAIDLYNSIWINNSVIANLLNKYEIIVVYERIYSSNGLFSEINELKNALNSNTKLIAMNFKNFVGHGVLDDINSKTDMDINGILKVIKNIQ